jgi:hypothetical protein
MQQQKRLREGRLVVVPPRGRRGVVGIKYSRQRGKEYKILHEEERKERQDSRRTSPLIYINPPLNTSLSSLAHSSNRKFLC